MDRYCESIFQTKRWKTREVKVGNIGIGGNNPVRIQSMTTSNTRDAEATIQQIIRLADAGCEIARVTVQGMKEAEACEQIKNGLLQKGYTIPVVADIHFYPPAAMRVVEFVDKVRVNPGNFVDKRASFKTIEYDDLTYAKEIEKIEEKFTPLVEKCKHLKKAIRIGTNHGSLSDRIMNRYGDTAMGMVESALEFARVCRKNDFHDIIFSMKASNPQVMVQAYRLLVREMIRLGWDYPLHLGVTEAGEGEDGRIKSAMGIGTLLLDGLGDTIRVSLTEDPWNEIDPCKRLVALAQAYQGMGIDPFVESFRNIEQPAKREVVHPKTISTHRDGTVVVNVSTQDMQQPDFYEALGLGRELGRPKLKISGADCLILKDQTRPQDKSRVLDHLTEAGVSIFSATPNYGEIKILPLKEALLHRQRDSIIERFSVTAAPAADTIAVIVSEESVNDWTAIETIKPSLIFLSPKTNRLHYCRRFFDWMIGRGIKIPVILRFSYACSKEDLVIHAAAEYGALFCDGLGDGIAIDAPYEIEFLRTLCFNILQAARMRTTKTDFISCPSCGRTLFDLQEVSRRIRSRTDHLPGVKIAIMGCIVNGPGEMADADFGYVGSKPGMIDLYVGKQCVQKDIVFEDAVDRLIDLIKSHGRWVDPQPHEVEVLSV